MKKLSLRSDGGALDLLFDYVLVVTFVAAAGGTKKKRQNKVPGWSGGSGYPPGVAVKCKGKSELERDETNERMDGWTFVLERARRVGNRFLLKVFEKCRQSSRSLVCCAEV